MRRQSCREPRDGRAAGSIKRHLVTPGGVKLTPLVLWTTTRPPDLTRDPGTTQPRAEDPETWTTITEL